VVATQDWECRPSRGGLGYVPAARRCRRGAPRRPSRGRLRAPGLRRFGGGGKSPRRRRREGRPRPCGARADRPRLNLAAAAWDGEETRGTRERGRWSGIWLDRRVQKLGSVEGSCGGNGHNGNVCQAHVPDDSPGCCTTVLQTESLRRPSCRL
jgi:hypothetical protein